MERFYRDYNVGTMPKPVPRAEIDPATALETISRLVPFGFGDAEFEGVHHWGSKGKLKQFRRYCDFLIDRKAHFRPNDNNHLLHLRLLFILSCCDERPTSKQEFRRLIKEALNAHSPLEKKAK